MTLMTGGRVTILTALIATVLSVQCAMAKDVPAAERDVADILSAMIKYETPEDNDGYVDCLYDRGWGGVELPKSYIRAYLNLRVGDNFETKNEKPAEYFLIMAGVPKEQICGVVTDHPSKAEIQNSLRNLIFRKKVKRGHVATIVSVAFGAPAFNRRRNRALVSYQTMELCYSLKKNGGLHSGLNIIYNSAFFLEKDTVWKVVKKEPYGRGEGSCEENGAE